MLIVGGFNKSARKRVEEFSVQLLQNLNEGIAKGQAEGGTIVIEMTLTFDLEGLDEFNEEMNRLRLMAGFDPWDDEDEGP